MHLLQIHEPGETPLPHEGGVAVGIDLGTTHSVVAFADGGVASVLHDFCGGTLVPSVVQYAPQGVRVGKEAAAARAGGEAGIIASVKRRMGNAKERLALPDGREVTPVEVSAEILRHVRGLAEKALDKEVTQAVITVPAYFDDAARQATKDAARLAGLEVLRLINEPTAAALAYGLDNAAEGIYAIYDLGGGTFDISLLKLEGGVFQVLATAGDTALGGDDFDHALLALLGWEATGANLAAARRVKEGLSDDDSITPPPAGGGRGEGGAVGTALFTTRNPTTLEYAKELRKNLTDAEKKLWHRLNRGQLGIKFRRQQAIGPYIVDFVSMEKMLVIEVDGGQHALHEKEDATRTEYLNRAGYRVLRFWNNEILANMEGVLEIIGNACVVHPHPNPPPLAGEGEQRLSPPLAGEGVSVTRTEFEAAIAPLVQRSMAICAGALRDAGLAKEDVKGVVLVGGSTRVPLVRREVEAFFGKTPLTNVNPDEVVAVGAALQAAALTQGADHLLLDVTPLSLGLETMGGIVEKIIHRNSPIPVATAQEFTTYQDGQTAMVIHVLQGERETVEQCRSLARFTLTGIPPMVAGAARIKVTFALDADGLLTVAAREETTGAEQRIEVKPSYGLSFEEIETMLRESMEHAREDITERLLREAKMEAERAALEVESALRADGALLSSEERAAIESRVHAVRAAAATRDRDAIDAATQALHHLTQPFAEKRMDAAVRKALKGSSIDAVARNVQEAG